MEYFSSYECSRRLGGRRRGGDIKTIISPNSSLGDMMKYGEKNSELFFFQYLKNS